LGEKKGKTDEKNTRRYEVNRKRVMQLRKRKRCEPDIFGGDETGRKAHGDYHGYKALQEEKKGNMQPIHHTFKWGRG